MGMRIDSLRKRHLEGNFFFFIFWFPRFNLLVVFESRQSAAFI